VSLVRGALVRSAGVGVNISDDVELGRATALPERAEVATVEADDAGVEGMWVEVVVQDEVDDLDPLVRASTEQECAAFANALPSCAQSS